MKRFSDAVRERGPYDQELLHHKTIYAGGPKFEYKAYARMFPGTEQSVVRVEWTMLGSPMIRERLGVETVNDVLQLHVNEIFPRLHAQFIIYEEIDHEETRKVLDACFSQFSTSDSDS